MTTITEAAFMDVVEVELNRRVGDENVIREPHLPSGRIPDFLVDGPFCVWLVEVENSVDDLASGIGQALLYAGEYADGHDAEPVVFIPTPVDDFIELEAARESVRVIPLDPTDTEQGP